jgi:thiol-disulfide isomerase/thioredoxin
MLRRTLLLSAAAFALACPLPTVALAQNTVPATPLVPAGQTGVKTAQPAEKKPVYDEKADAKQQIAAALKKAKAENQRVLIQWGGNWCGWCIALHGLYAKDKDIAHELLYEYQVVYVDAGQPKGKNIELAKSYGADLEKNGFPFLTILDADGKALANQETSSLETDHKLDSGHNPAAVLDLLKKYQATYLSASGIFEAGLAEAKRSGKTVFLHFGAPWCGWCHKLENWMATDEVRSILSKQFVDVKIDVDRTIGAKEIFDKYRGPKDTGIPWFAFLDPTGKSLADATGPKGNVGFPYEPNEVAHFESMLRKVPGKLTDADIKALVGSLNGNREKEEKNTGH